MDIVLLGITVVSLIVALVMSVTAMRVARDEKLRAAARVAALSLAAGASDDVDEAPLQVVAGPKTLSKAPWAPAPRAAGDAIEPAIEASIPLNTPAPETIANAFHASGFLGASEEPHEGVNRQKTLAFAAIGLFVVLGGATWMMSGSQTTTAQAIGANAPLELVSMTHQRQNDKLSVSGLVRNPAAGAPVERLSAVVFLFDRTGTFVTSSRAHVDFLKLGAGDESPFVVSLDAPQNIARYRVSFRTDEGIVPHVDRRSASPGPAEGEQALTVSAK